MREDEEVKKAEEKGFEEKNTVTATAFYTLI